jgi:predicted NAD-dependent protein-ADP-ribosyltransferase YbiA (DUF1768 family)
MSVLFFKIMNWYKIIKAEESSDKNFSETIDIGSGGGYPEDALSNFTSHPFVIDGVYCHTMEGFLQSLKFRDQENKKEFVELIKQK